MLITVQKMSPFKCHFLGPVNLFLQSNRSQNFQARHFIIPHQAICTGSTYPLQSTTRHEAPFLSTARHSYCKAHLDTTHPFYLHTVAFHRMLFCRLRRFPFLLLPLTLCVPLPLPLLARLVGECRDIGLFMVLN